MFFEHIAQSTKNAGGHFDDDRALSLIIDCFEGALRDIRRYSESPRNATEKIYSWAISLFFGNTQTALDRVGEICKSIKLFKDNRVKETWVKARHSVLALIAVYNNLSYLSKHAVPKKIVNPADLTVIEKAIKETDKKFAY